MKAKSPQANLGLEFEQAVESYCEHYRTIGDAFIEKLEIKKTKIGKFMVYKKKSPFDFIGIAKSRVPISFECKSKKSPIAETAKFKMVTELEVAMAKKGKFKSHTLGIMPHQISGLQSWITDFSGCGFLFFRILQTGKNNPNKLFYGIVSGENLCSIYNEWKNGTRTEIRFSECDIFLDSPNFLEPVVASYLRGGR